MTAISVYSKMLVTIVIAVTKKARGGEAMRSKTLGINVRVTEKEKERLQQNASCCLLSVSEYLRRL